MGENKPGCTNILIGGGLFVIVACAGLWIMTNITDPQAGRISDQAAGYPEGTYNFLPFGLLLIPVAIWGVMTYLRRPVHAHRNTRHAQAEILWDGECANQIKITNLDSVDVDDLSRNMHWSSLRMRERDGDWTWVWTFQYMGDKRGENFADPMHLYYMRQAAENINAYLEDTTNPRKDVVREGRK